MFSQLPARTEPTCTSISAAPRPTNPTSSPCRKTWLCTRRAPFESWRIRQVPGARPGAPGERDFVGRRARTPGPAQRPPRRRGRAGAGCRSRPSRPITPSWDSDSKDSASLHLQRLIVMTSAVHSWVSSTETTPSRYWTTEGRGTRGRGRRPGDRSGFGGARRGDSFGGRAETPINTMVCAGFPGPGSRSLRPHPRIARDSCCYRV